MNQIGNYKILRKLGEGGMGTVLVGQDLSTGVEVAIKLVKTDMASVQAVLSRFKREIKISKQFAHPYVIKILDGGIVTDQNIMYLVMELLPGQSMGDACRKSRLKSEEAFKIMTHMGKAFSYIHDRGIIHRDIKPDNILVVSPERTVLLDFGLALAEDLTRLSRTSDRAGTWVTMSPEQLTGTSVDGRSDIYSFGITMYWALTGRGAYTSDEIVQIAVGNSPPIPSAPHLLVKDVDPFLSDIVMKCMSVPLEDRFQSAEDLVESLKSRKIVERATNDPIAPLTQEVPVAEKTSVPSQTAGDSRPFPDKIRSNSSGRHNPLSKGFSHNGSPKVSVNSSGCKNSGKNVRRVFAMLVLGVCLIIGIFIFYSARSEDSADGAVDKQQSNSFAITSDRSHNGEVLRSMTTKILQGKAIPNNNSLVAYGKLVMAVLSKEESKRESVVADDEKRVNFVGGIYYLFLSAAESKRWAKASQYMEPIIENYGFHPVTNDVLSAVELIHSSKDWGIGVENVLFLSPKRHCSTELLVVTAALSESMDKGDSFLSNLLKAASTSEQREDCLLALTRLHFAKYSVANRSSVSPTLKKNRAMKKVLELCRTLKKENVGPENLTIFTWIYLSALRKPYTEESREEALEVIGYLEGRADLPPEGRLELFVRAGKLLTSCFSLSAALREDQLLALEYRKKAMELGRKLKVKDLHSRALDLAETYSELGDRTSADMICQRLIKEQPEYKKNGSFIIGYNRMLMASMRFAESNKLITSVLKADKVEGFLTLIEKEKLRYSLERSSKLDNLLKVKNTGRTDETGN